MLSGFCGFIRKENDASATFGGGGMLRCVSRWRTTACPPPSSPMDSTSSRITSATLILQCGSSAGKSISISAVAASARGMSM